MYDPLIKKYNMSYKVHQLTVMFFIPDSRGGSHDKEVMLTVLRGHSIPPTVTTTTSHGSEMHGTFLP